MADMEEDTVHSGIEMREVSMAVRYELVSLFEGRMEIMLPEGFREMPEEMAKWKYPSIYRPPIIMMSGDTRVNCYFCLMDVPLPAEETVRAAEGLRTNIKRNQTVEWTGEVVEKPDGKAAWFTYENRTLDENAWNMVFVTGIGGKLVYGGFNCPRGEEQEWAGRAEYSISTIQDKTEV